MKLTIVTTGGTIDKIYFDVKSDFQVGDPQIGVILEALNLALDFEVISLMRKDSLDITEEDRQLLFDTIANHANDRFLITHGTDTLVQTALFLDALAADNTIILTGALNPARFVGSDAVFNIGCAVAACQTEDPGIFIAMNGRIWNPLLVHKNVDTNRFEPIPSDQIQKTDKSGLS